MAGRKATRAARSATVRVTREARPKRPKVDRGEAFDQIVRQMYKAEVDAWVAEEFKDRPSEKPNKAALGEAVDHLTATYTMPLQTLVAATADEYLSAVGDDVDEVECPECQEVFELDEEQCKALDEAEAGDAVELECPKCKATFELPADDDAA